ncbi:TPA: accessory colonization factor AcfA, partial [Vibrio cholerae]|nr:multidrug ABC transporter permease [Vibrio cholerae]HCG1896712.1 accessory colonization factor AcfA [Vibrio cholerae]
NAAPYIGLELGIGTANHSFETNYQSDAVSLNPNMEDMFLGGLIGYKFNDNFSFEINYSSYKLEDQYSKFIGIESLNNQQYRKEHEWSSEIEAKQLALISVYSYPIHQQLKTNIKVGVTHTQYEAYSGKYEELELLLNDDIEIRKALLETGLKKNRFGALFSLGLDYNLIPELSVGTELRYQFDKYNDVLSISLNSKYYF